MMESTNSSVLNGLNDWSLVGTKDAYLASLETELHQAVADQQLSVWYQPIVRGADKIVAMEALCRWGDKSSGFISPDVFIPLAEKNYLINDLGDLVLRKTLQSLERWAELGSPFEGRVAINVSHSQLCDPSFSKRILAQFESSYISPRQFNFEITERDGMHMSVVKTANMHMLREAGISFTLDEFGTGYNSLLQLSELPVDCMKIDSIFIGKMGSSRGLALVKSMVLLAKTMGLSIIAEGVESLGQRNALFEMNCDVHQGALYGGPMESTDFFEWCDYFAL